MVISPVAGGISPVREKHTALDCAGQYKACQRLRKKRVRGRGSVPTRGRAHAFSANSSTKNAEAHRRLSSNSNSAKTSLISTVTAPAASQRQMDSCCIKAQRPLLGAGVEEAQIHWQ